MSANTYTVPLLSEGQVIVRIDRDQLILSAQHPHSAAPQPVAMRLVEVEFLQLVLGKAAAQLRGAAAKRQPAE